MDIVYKVVRKLIDNKLVSTEISIDYQNIFVCEYVTGVASEPPTEHSYAWLYAFATLETAQEWMRLRSIFQLIIFEATASQTRPVSHMCSSTDEKYLEAYWLNIPNEYATKMAPKGTIQCSDITLVKEVDRNIAIPIVWEIKPPEPTKIKKGAMTAYANRVMGKI